MLRAPKPYIPPDDELSASYANHYTITAACTCGHSRELIATHTSLLAMLFANPR
jgi:hypothetical protein